MGTIKTKPFDLEAIKNGAKYGIFRDNKYSKLFNTVPVELYIPVGNSKNKYMVRFGVSNYLVDSCGLLEAGAIKHEIRIIQEPKLASDLSEVKVGDKVWTFGYGWGTIKSTDYISSNPIQVKFIEVLMSYTRDGKSIKSIYANQSLFLTEIKFEIPEV